MAETFLDWLNTQQLLAKQLDSLARIAQALAQRSPKRYAALTTRKAWQAHLTREQADESWYAVLDAVWETYSRDQQRDASLLHTRGSPYALLAPSRPHQERRRSMTDDQAGLRMPQAAIRDARLKIASDLLALTLKETALLPVAQQQRVRQAVRALTEVQQWCKAHQA